jgi:Uma2 family endonuclease
MASAVLSTEQCIRVPSFAHSLAGFRSWAKSRDFPDRGRFSFIGGEIVIDMSPEAIETHNKVKGTIDATLRILVGDKDLGQFYGDSVLVTNVAANLSTEPDGTFVSWKPLESNRTRLVPHKGTAEDYIEIEGSPDMVLEVVSSSSVWKDTVQLKETYHRAGVREYWLVDARGAEVSFRVLVRRSTGYVAVQSRGGWVRSEVFGCSFRIERRRDRMNLWRYTLRMRSK